MARYINASDVSKLLGEDYGVYWSTDAENLNIVNNIRERYQPEKPITFELNTKTVETIQQLPKSEISKIVSTLELTNAYKFIFSPDDQKYHRTDEGKDLTTLTVKELKTILKVPVSSKLKKQELITAIKETVQTEIVIESLNKTKKETVILDTHSEYDTKTKNVLAQIEHPLLKSVLDTDFTMERGNVEEEKIIKEFQIKKDNKFRSCSFEVDEQAYKVGCRFDGENVEIKTRKNKFLGVPIYEKVQMHFYMVTSCVSEWTLKEKYNDKIQDHLVPFDSNFFEQVKNDLHQSWEKYVSIK
jgi:hypothetical protein